MEWAKILEDAIMGRLVSTLIDEGFRLEISDQDGGTIGATYIYAAKDGGEKPADGYNYYVQVIPGNGPDLIHDYTTNLEKFLKPVLAFAATFSV